MAQQTSVKTEGPYGFTSSWWLTAKRLYHEGFVWRRNEGGLHKSFIPCTGADREMAIRFMADRNFSGLMDLWDRLAGR